MRYAIAALVALGLFASPAFASPSQDTMKACAASWKSMSAADRAKTSYHEYSTSCMKAGGPSSTGTYGGMGPPEGATAACQDGTYYKGKSHSGACSHHGGVAKWL
jgi:hypothetical protein